MVNFLEICIFMGFDQFFKEAVNIKMSAINNYILSVKYWLWACELIWACEFHL
jgi:hypothetical protein